MNIKEIKWDSELLSLFKVPSQILPELKESADEFGNWKFNGVNIPILGVAGDQQAALFGQECYEVGMAKNLLNKMRKEGIRPNEVSFNSVIGACASTARWKDALAVLDQCYREPGVQPNIYIYTNAMR